MSCNLYTLKGIARGCKDSLGGIVKVWVAGDYDTARNAVKDGEGTVGIDKTAIPANFKVFNFFKNTGSMTSTLNVSENAGSSFSTELALVFMKQETAKRLEMMGLFMGQALAVVKDANGKYWLLGYDNPVEASAGTAQSGTASTDLNGYNITLRDDSRELPFEITDAETIAALEAITIA